MNDDNGHDDDQLRDAFGAVARQFEEEATLEDELGEVLWTNDAGDRCFGRYVDGEGSTLTIRHVDGRRDLVHRSPGVDYRTLR